MEEEVKLHGFWASPYSLRVIWALKLKGIKYQYIEEDLPNNKSDLLLEYNPIHKKVPVLVHAGKPIAESLVILEYIEETWPQNPLLPTDAYEKAVARFWFTYQHDKGRVVRKLLESTGEEQAKAAEELLDMLKILEEKGLGKKKFFGGSNGINLVDIAHGWLVYWLQIMEQLVGVKLIDQTSLPRLFGWAENFMESPIIRENLPDRQKLLDYMRNKRERFVSA